jgi:fibronectin type 3 domain-containing protein
MILVGCDPENGLGDNNSPGGDNPGGDNPGGNGVTIPNAPTGVSASAISSSTIQVSWNTVSGATEYLIYYGTGFSFLSLSATSSPATITGLNPSTTYNIFVEAGNSAGRSSSSNQVTATTLPPSLPSTPTGVTATALGSAGIRISWNPVAGATGYRIYSPNTAGSNSNFQLLDTTTSTSYTDSLLSANQTWFYRVSAFNSVGESSQSSSVSARTSAPLPGPTNVIAAHADYTSRRNTSRNSILITWNAVPGAVSYNVYYWVTFLGGYWERASFSPVTGTSFNHTGLTPATSYSYNVRAVDASGGEGNNSTPQLGTAIGRTAP